MTVFCTSCGAPNTEQATRCTKCSAELARKSQESAKFKGTMMMGAVPPRPQTPGTPSSPDTDQPAGAPPAGAAPSAPQKKELAFQKTMPGPMVPPTAAAPPPSATPEGPPQADPHGAASPAAPSGSSEGAPGVVGPSSQAAATPASPGPAGVAPSPNVAASAPASAAVPPSGVVAASSTPPGAGAPPAAYSSAQVPAGPPPAGPPPAGNSNKKTLLILGLGCLGLLLVMCIAGSVALWLLWGKAADAIEEKTQLLGAVSPSRKELAAMLTAVDVACAVSPNGQAARNLVHPDVAADIGAKVCEIDESAIRVFGNVSLSTEGPPTGAYAEKVRSIGIPEARCLQYTAGLAVLLVCIQEDGSRQVVALDNLDQIDS